MPAGVMENLMVGFPLSGKMFCPIAALLEGEMFCPIATLLEGNLVCPIAALLEGDIFCPNAICVCDCAVDGWVASVVNRLAVASKLYFKNDL